VEDHNIMEFVGGCEKLADQGQVMVDGK